MRKDTELSKGREFNKIAPVLWRSKRFNSLSSIGKIIHLYMMTCEHQNSAGCFRLPDAYAVSDLGCTLNEYIAGRDELVAAELISFDAETSEVFVHRWFKHNPATNDKHAIGTERLIGEIESDILREKAEVEFFEADQPRQQRHAANNSLANTRYLNPARTA